MNLDINQLLSTGAMTGPHRRTHALTLTWRTRATRWLQPAGEFASVWMQYRKHHSWAYAASRAWGIAIKGASF